MTQASDTPSENGGRGLVRERASESDSSLHVQEVTERVVAAVRAGGGHGLVAARSGIAARTLSNLLAGQDPKYQQLLAIARATGVRLEWLATGHGPMHPSEVGVFSVDDELAGDDTGGPLPTTVLIRRYDARASAGPGTGVDSGPLVENMAFPAAFVHEQLRRDPEHLAVIECIGDSMEPTLHDGDLLLVDTSRQRPTTGRIYVLRVGDALLAKRMQRLAGGGWSLISDNPRYATEELRPSDETRLDVLGEVVWRSGNLAP